MTYEESHKIIDGVLHKLCNRCFKWYPCIIDYFDGSNKLDNCIPACKSCNSHKWKFDFSKWYNENNPNYNQERFDKIQKWLNEDYKKYLDSK